MKKRIPWNKGKKGIYSEESKRKMGLAAKGRTSWMKGRKHSEESKRKMSASLKGRKLSEEHRRKLRGRLSPMKGKKHSEETRKKMSQRVRTAYARG